MHLPVRRDNHRRAGAEYQFLYGVSPHAGARTRMKAARSGSRSAADIRPPPHPEIGRLFRECREHLGWIQDDVAQVSGVCKRVIQKAEAGDRIRHGSHNEIVGALRKEYKKRNQNDIFPDIPYPRDKDHRGQGPSVANSHEVIMRETLRILDPLDQNDKLRLGSIRSSAELKCLGEIDDVFFGETNFTYQHLFELWEAFPFGLRTLFSGNDIIGAMGIWPVTEK
jgi:hypothetical protein